MSTVSRLIDPVADLWPGDGVPDDTLGRLVLASHLLGADRAVSNFGGGNTSAKGTAADPVAAHRASGYVERVSAERGATAGVAGGWGR